MFRLLGEQALLKFDNLRAAVKVMEVFDRKFLSDKQNHDLCQEYLPARQH